MIKLKAIVIALVIIQNAMAQQQKKFSTNMDFHINSTLYDRTATNNATGFGLGLQSILQIRPKYAATLEIAGDVYAGTKELYMTSMFEPIHAKGGVSTIMAGALYNITSKFNVGAMAGMALFNGESYFAIKPSVNYQLTKNRIIGKIAWANIFHKDDISDQSFGYLSFGIGVKLF